MAVPFQQEKYGDVDVLYEPKRESRLNDPRRMRLRDFLQLYNTTDMYVVSQTPTAMLHEVYAPQCLLCGSLSRSIEETNIWISSVRGCGQHLRSSFFSSFGPFPPSFSPPAHISKQIQ